MAVSQAKEWSVGQAEHVDPLLDALQWVLAREGQSLSGHSLVAGLPLDRGTLTTDSFPRAAARAGLDAHLKALPLAELHRHPLPMILLLSNKECAVLTDVKGGKGQWLRFPQQRQQDGELETLAGDYLGYAFVLTKASGPGVDAMPQKNDKHIFWHSLWERRGLYRDAVLASFLVNFFALVVPLFIMNVYDKVVPNLAFESLWVLAAGALLAFTFDVVLRLVRSRLLDLAGRQAEQQLSQVLMGRSLGAPLAQRAPSLGMALKRFQDFDYLRDFISSSTIALVVDLPFASLFLLVIWVISGVLVVVPLLAASTLIVGALLLSRSLHKTVTLQSHLASLKQSQLAEMLAMPEFIKACGAEHRCQQGWEQLVAAQAQVQNRMREQQHRLSTLANLMVQLTVVGVVVLGVVTLADGHSSLGAIVAAVMLSSRTVGPFAQLANLIARYQQAKVGMKALDEALKQPDEFEGATERLHRPITRGAYQLDAVSFTYPGTELPAVSEFNLNIRQGERVGIIGRTGCGKTTLARLLMGFYLPEKGHLLVDGVEVRQRHPTDMRRGIGYLAQDARLVAGSIRDNIVFGLGHVPDSQVMDAAEQAGLGAFINVDESGLSRKVGEGGIQLSLGQRHLVALARALVMKPKILILDEPTASLDPATENKVIRQLAALGRDTTLVIITHKQSLLDLVDRLIVMEHGRLVVDGPKEKVLEWLKEQGGRHE
ncbi:type I secretion system permease/ATPase [Gallaecimonas kandeliae]|uniref:type I secretion system permease/ATPase n=1 Tax=Gallaecimonas kandeliae TaxID=3029055 RepID=UPI002648505C|nr:type I secretion system permease/ATPase [Gallaecimonas kandeliae]WKE65128.1 type I secretion system permease/ATPase [Gallaecimonas kandeliae]